MGFNKHAGKNWHDGINNYRLPQQKRLNYLACLKYILKQNLICSYSQAGKLYHILFCQCNGLLSVSSFTWLTIGAQ